MGISVDSRGTASMILKKLISAENPTKLFFGIVLKNLYFYGIMDTTGG